MLWPDSLVSLELTTPTAILYASYFQPTSLSPLAFTRTILSRPDYALHVTSLASDAFDQFAPNIQRLEDSELEIVEKSVLSLSADDPREAEHWIQRIESGDHDAVTALLIFHLPNLQKLNLEIRRTEMCLTHLTKRVYRLSNSLAQVSFSKSLGGVYVVRDDWSDLDLRDISPLFEFIKLKSLRRFTLRKYLDMSFDCRMFAPASLSMVEVCFVESDIPPFELKSMLGWYKELKRFHYDYRSAREYRYRELPGEVGKALCHLKVSVSSK